MDSTCKHCNKPIKHYSGIQWDDSNLIFPQYCYADPVHGSRLHEPLDDYIESKIMSETLPALTSLEILFEREMEQGSPGYFDMKRRNSPHGRVEYKNDETRCAFFGFETAMKILTDMVTIEYVAKK